VKYIQPFTYFARKPKTGFNNVLMGCVCTLIPVIGPIVLLGYRAEVMDHLERDPEMKDHPDFKFDHFMRYLQRGLWPFLANLIVSLGILMPGIIIGIVVGIAVTVNSSERLFGMVAAAAVTIVFVFLTKIFAWPMEIYAMKTKQFQPVAELRFALVFLRKVGFETLVSLFIFNMMSQALLIVGLLMCYVGMYPAASVVSMAEQHIMTQLYLRYLDEGGEPIGGSHEFDDPDRDEPRRAEAVVE
jgi:hypothetical protein